MRFVKETIINATPERVFAFHELPDAINRLMPPWETAQIIKAAPNLHVGSQALIAIKFLGVASKQWLAEHTRYEPPYLFEDEQVYGPFKSWRHQHIIEPHPEGAVLRDEILFEPPLGFLGRLGAPLAVLPKLRKMFDFRHQVTKKWCEEQELTTDEHG